MATFLLEDIKVEIKPKVPGIDISTGYIIIITRCSTARCILSNFNCRDLTLENLRYLNSRQALADLAQFIDFFRQEKKLKDNKLITFGGSYPGV